jgi:hypothetical protein
MIFEQAVILLPMNTLSNEMDQHASVLNALITFESTEYHRWLAFTTGIGTVEWVRQPQVNTSMHITIVYGENDNKWLQLFLGKLSFN